MKLERVLREIAKKTAREVAMALRSASFAEIGAFSGKAHAPRPELDYAQAKAAAIREFERSYIAALMDRHGGHVYRAAKAARMSNVSLYRILDRHGMRRR